MFNYSIYLQFWTPSLLGFVPDMFITELSSCFLYQMVPQFSLRAKERQSWITGVYLSSERVDVDLDKWPIKINLPNG